MDRLPIINLTFQTSDLAKLALFMYLSRLLSKKQDVIKDFKKGFLPIIIPVGIICVLIAPANLSTALLVGATSLLLMFIGRVSMKHIAAGDWNCNDPGFAIDNGSCISA